MHRAIDYRISSKGGTLALYANDTLLFRQAYKEPLGRLVGLEFVYAGNGHITNVKLRNQDQGNLIKTKWR